MNEFTENEWLPNFELKLKFLENLKKILRLKSTRKCIDIDLERVPMFAHWRGSQKQKTFGFAQVALAMRFKKNSLPDE